MQNRFSKETREEFPIRISMPLYMQLYNILRQMIMDQTLKPGDMLPTESELMKQYKVSRITVRQAINLLVQEGLVFRKSGKGTFVSPISKINQQLGTLRSFTEEIRMLGFTPGVILHRHNWITADQEIAEKLGINVGDLVLEVIRIRLANDIKISVNYSYFPEKYGRLLENEVASLSLYEVIEKRIGMISKAFQTISAHVANKEEATLLGIKYGSPLLRVERVTYLTNNDIVEFVKANFLANLYRFCITLMK
ncbi:MAG: GntR family transcriptional regulator [Caldanaerobacter subterraneus]|nr:GntR family transcriptional regulator [Caldanaerobacter subterraneus]KUK08463.1 MAG: GntR family transcriptional regulator [Caldanaerobacter subterraneus]